jgi:hypothetical protein
MQKKTKIIFLGICGLLILIVSPFVFILAWVYFASPDLSPQYGMTTISVGGKQVYFKREARGLNYDNVILSSSSDFCAEYNAETDFRFPGMDNVIYYKINGEILQIISSPNIKPQNFPVKVEVREVTDPMEWFRLKDTHKENGIELLNVQLSDEMKCN